MPEFHDYVGYVAVATFTLSYVTKTEVGLLRAQLFAASLWIFYGVLRNDHPVIVANVLVAAFSVFKQVRLYRKARAA